MKLDSKKAVQELLSLHEFTPSKGLGQNFLIDQHVVDKLISAVDIQPSNVILEIGPGVGTLTQGLAQNAKKVIAIEKDQKMIVILRETMADFKNVEIIHGDALKFDYTKYKLQDTKYKLIANLPYYITAPVIRKFLELCEAKPSTMTLIIQKEVAQRICAKPPRMSILSSSVQFYATPKIISSIKKTSFWPQPKVDSTIIQITPHKENSQIDSQQFFTVMKAGFKQPRKQLLNNLSTQLRLPREQVELWLSKNSIKTTQRAETLSIQDWINLTQTMVVE